MARIVARLSAQILLPLAILCVSPLMAAETGEPEIFICINHDKIEGIGTAGEVLVYSYINGEKTPCMRKPELLVYYRDKTGCGVRKDPEIEKRIQAVDSCKKSHGTGVNLSSANLKTNDLMKTCMAKANLQGADLSSADLRGANLRGANLQNANLQAAYLKGADLRDADVTGAELGGAFLNKADIRGIKGLDMDQVREIRTFFETKMDPDLYEAIKYSFPEKFKEASWYWHNNEWADWRAQKNGEKTTQQAPAPEEPSLE